VRRRLDPGYAACASDPHQPVGPPDLCQSLNHFRHPAVELTGTLAPTTAVSPGSPGAAPAALRPINPRYDTSFRRRQGPASVAGCR